MIATPTIIQSIGAALFAIALVHTFSTKYFERLAHQRPDHAGIWHLLGEVEIVFAVWAGALILAMMLVAGRESATTYLDSRDFTEPLFVFAIIVIAGSRPILDLANAGVRVVAGSLPMAGAPAMYFTVLAFVPLLGSFITEPAAMTLAALILRERDSRFIRYMMALGLTTLAMGPVYSFLPIFMKEKVGLSQGSIVFLSMRNGETFVRIGLPPGNRDARRIETTPNSTPMPNKSE